jgi:hypothetical protein
MKPFLSVRIVPILLAIALSGVLAYNLSHKREKKNAPGLVSQSHTQTAPSSEQNVAKQAELVEHLPAVSASANTSTYYSANYASVQSEASRSIDSKEFRATIEAMREKRNQRLAEQK